MINIFNKITILNYINKNKDKVEYDFNYDIADFTELHKVEINGKHLVAISMQKNINNDDIFFCLEYNFHENNKSSYKIVKPNQQSCIDTFFISKMYRKMLDSYIAKSRDYTRKK